MLTVGNGFFARFTWRKNEWIVQGVQKEPKKVLRRLIAENLPIKLLKRIKLKIDLISAEIIKKAIIWKLK